LPLLHRQDFQVPPIPPPTPLLLPAGHQHVNIAVKSLVEGQTENKGGWRTKCLKSPVSGAYMPQEMYQLKKQQLYIRDSCPAREIISGVISMKSGGWGMGVLGGWGGGGSPIRKFWECSQEHGADCAGFFA